MFTTCVHSMRLILTSAVVVGLNLCPFWGPAKVHSQQSTQSSASEPTIAPDNQGNLKRTPFSLDDFPGLEEECLSAVENEELAKAIVARLQTRYESVDQPEAIKMLISILSGSMMGSGEGWFGEAKQMYTWEWLASKHNIQVDETLSKDDFQGEASFFERLDRNGDGNLGVTDFDWSSKSAYMKEQSTANWIFRKIDDDHDGKVSRNELLAFYSKSKGDDADLSIDEFRRALELGKPGGGFMSGDAPTPERLLKGFFSSEVGSLQEGPAIGDLAPDFELTTQDGKEVIHLQDWIGKKPIVLIFGNFTCGPFRRTYPDFDEISLRYKDKANFFGVYVREAHPTDGWKMESNSSSGVRLKQPKTIEQRIEVAKRCATTLKYSMPLLVDTMDDRVGNLYSGMPARAYVIGTDGKVTYQSGRGPFGFRPPEMEQALLLLLLAEEAKTK